MNRIVPWRWDPSGNPLYEHIVSQGNGQLLAYSHGPDIADIYRPYTSTSLARILLSPVAGHRLETRTVRVPGTPIRRHILSINQENEPAEGPPVCPPDGPIPEGVPEIRDVVPRDVPALLRLYRNLETPILQRIRFPGRHRCWSARRDPEPGTILIQFEVLPGNAILFHTDARSSYGFLRIRGQVDGPVEPVNLEGRNQEGGEGDLVFRIGPGDADLAFVADLSHAGAVEAVEFLSPLRPEDLERDAVNSWRRFTGRLDPERLGLVPGEADQWRRDLLEEALLLIRCQQSLEGGLPSAHFLPVGYSRDNYGAVRGLLAMGYPEAARSILEFRFGKFQRFGDLVNAEAMGRDEPRHPAENDHVEQTSYLVLAARDYWRATGDDTHIRTILPMLEWCLRVQLPHLVEDMLPFNGDETYVAGFLLPRSALLHGAAEATLLFLLAAEWLCGWARRNGTLDRLREVACAASRVRSGYRTHFLRNGRLVANAPEREAALRDRPRFKFGVCEQGSSLGQIHFGWLETDGGGHYLCPWCRNGAGYQGPPAPGPVEIPSVSLLPAYLGSDLLAPAETLSLARRFLADFRPENRTVGYDPALLLYTLVSSGGTREEIAEAESRVLSLRDVTGSWNEYYENGRSLSWCNKHRPWETGYSVDALLQAWRLPRLPLSPASPQE